MIEEVQFGPVTQYRLKRRILGQVVYATAAYQVDGLLIDTGFEYVAEDFYRRAAEKGVDQIVHTHAHEDHVAADHLFQARQGLTPKAHAAGLALLSEPPAKLKPYRRVVWGLPKATRAEAVGDVVETPNFSFRVIHAPGHSLDHLAFYEPNQGWLFGGDLYLSVKVKVLKYDEDFHAWKRSLQNVAKLDLARYFCGSGKVLETPPRYLGLKLEYYEEIEHNVVRLHRRGWPLRRIGREVLGPESWLTYISQGEFSKLNLVKSILRSELS